MKRLLLPLFVVLLLSLSAFSAKAYEAPDVSIKELNIDSSEASFRNGGVIDGKIKLSNNSNLILNDLSCVISLVDKDASIKEVVFPVSEQIYSQKELEQSFSYFIPQNIRSGKYNLKVQLLLKSGISLNEKERSVDISGGGIYLDISGEAVLKTIDGIEDPREYPPLSGVSFDPGENPPKIKFNIHNGNLEKINYKLEIIVYWFQSNMREVEKINNLEERWIDIGENRSRVISLPKYKNAGSYLAKVTLFRGGDSISNTESFRWVVKGQMARVLDMGLDKDAYSKGDTVKITTHIIGPPDTSDIGQGALVVTIYDQNGEVLSQKNKNISLNEKDKKETIEFIASTPIINPIIEAKIMKGKQEFDKYRIDLKSSPESIKRVLSSTPEKPNNYDMLLIIIIFSIIIIFIVLLLIIKYKKTKHISLMLIVLGFFMTSGYEAKAAVFSNDWEQPAEGAYFDLDQNITYKGDPDLPGCLNDENSSYIEAYICDDNDSSANCVPPGSDNKIISVYPKDTIIDNNNRKLYVIDAKASRIVKIDMDTKKIEKVFGERGTGVGQFQELYGGAYNTQKNFLYIIDKENKRIVRFRPDGNWNKVPADGGSWKTFDYSSSGNNPDFDFNNPFSAFYDDRPGNNRYLYISDKNNERIVRFQPENSSWESTSQVYGSDGHGDGEFTSPRGLFYDKNSGYLYVADAYTQTNLDNGTPENDNNRIVRFKPDDIKWNKKPSDGGSWQTFGSYGSGDGEFAEPYDVFFDSTNNKLYIADNDNNRIVRFNSPSASDWNTTPPIGSWETMTNIEGINYKWPADIDLDTATGTVYVSDTHNFRLVKFPLNNWVGPSDSINFYSNSGYEINGTVPPSVADFDASCGGTPGCFQFGPSGKAWAKVKIEFLDVNTGEEQFLEDYRYIYVNLASPTPTPISNYTISGNVFVDTDKNKRKDGLEINYQDIPVIGINPNPGAVITYSSCPGAQCGDYTVSNLPEGTYTVSYTSLPSSLGYYMIAPLNGPPPQFQVTVGPACDVGDILPTSPDAECY